MPQVEAKKTKEITWLFNERSKQRRLINLHQICSNKLLLLNYLIVTLIINERMIFFNIYLTKICLIINVLATPDVFLKLGSNKVSTGSPLFLCYFWQKRTSFILLTFRDEFIVTFLIARELVQSVSINWAFSTRFSALAGSLFF